MLFMEFIQINEVIMLSINKTLSSMFYYYYYYYYYYLFIYLFGFFFIGAHPTKYIEGCIVKFCLENPKWDQKSFIYTTEPEDEYARPLDLGGPHALSQGPLYPPHSASL